MIIRDQKQYHLSQRSLFQHLCLQSQVNRNSVAGTMTHNYFLLFCSWSLLNSSVYDGALDVCATFYSIAKY